MKSEAVPASARDYAKSFLCSDKPGSHFIHRSVSSDRHNHVCAGICGQFLRMPGIFCIEYFAIGENSLRLLHNRSLVFSTRNGIHDESNSHSANLRNYPL